MKKPLRFVTLLVFAALILTSCGELALPKNQLSSFSYTVDESLIQAIARVGTTSGDPLCTIRLTLKSIQPDVYNREIEKKNIPLSQLKGEKFEFDNLPLAVPMALVISVYSGDTLLYESLSQEFTLESTAPMNIKSLVYRELNTPTMVWNQNNDFFVQGGGYPLGEITWQTDYCFDGNDTLWVIDDEERLLSTDRDATEPTNHLRAVYKTDDDRYVDASTENQPDNTTEAHYLKNVKYDPITDKLCIIVCRRDPNGNTDMGSYIISVSPQELKSCYGKLISDCNFTKISMPFNSGDIMASYAYNGMLYSVNYTEDGFAVLKMSLATGELLATADLTDLTSWNESVAESFCDFLRITIPWYTDEELAAQWEELCETEDGFQVSFQTVQSYIENSHAWYNGQVEIYGAQEDAPPKLDEVFGLYTGPSSSSGQGAIVSGTSSPITNLTDFVVYKDTLFIPFHQQYYNHNDAIEPPYVFVDRGGILLLDAATLHVKDVIGLAPKETSVTLPVLIDGTYTFDAETSAGYKAQAFADAAMKQPLECTFNISWSMAGKTGQALRYPAKIIAIKPKKLVIADTGSFYYIDKNFFSTDSGSRIVTIDLETFAMSFEENSDTSILPPTNLINGIRFTYGTELGHDASVYGPKFINNNNQFSYSTTESEVFDSAGFEIVAVATFGDPVVSNSTSTTR